MLKTKPTLIQIPIRVGIPSTLGTPRGCSSPSCLSAHPYLVQRGTRMLASPSTFLARHADPLSGTQKSRKVLRRKGLSQGICTLRKRYPSGWCLRRQRGERRGDHCRGWTRIGRNPASYATARVYEIGQSCFTLRKLHKFGKCCRAELPTPGKIADSLG